MKKLLKIALFLGLVYLATVESRAAGIQTRKTWIFAKNRTHFDGNIECVGPFCDQVEIVKCTGVQFNVDYQCSSPDLRNGDHYEANYKIRCSDQKKIENDACLLEVGTMENSVTHVSPPNNPSLTNLTIFFTLILSSVFVLLSICAICYVYFTKK